MPSPEDELEPGSADDSVSRPVRAPAPDEWGWTWRHQVGLGILLFFLLVFLGVQLWRHPVRLSSALPLSPMHQSVLEHRIDLNSAGWASLVRLPGIGPGRADRILKYRSHALKLHPGVVVFRDIQDLRKVPGIGKKISLELLPFVKFPGHGQGQQRALPPAR